jgi:hypothetical protein
MIALHLYCKKLKPSESSAGILASPRNGHIGIKLAKRPVQLLSGLKFRALDSFAGPHVIHPSSYIGMGHVQPNAILH